LLIYLTQRSWRLLLIRSWRHARASLRIYQALAERELREALRVALLQLAASQERRAAWKAERLRKLREALPEDRDMLGARIWRWLLIRCGSRLALAWVDKVEEFYLAISWKLIWLAMKALPQRTKLPY